MNIPHHKIVSVPILHGCCFTRQKIEILRVSILLTTMNISYGIPNIYLFIFEFHKSMIFKL